MKREWMERLGFLILAALVWIPAARWEQQRSEPEHTAWEEAVARAREEVAQGAAALQKAQEAAAQRTAPEVVGESASDLPSNDAPKWVETRYVGLGNEGDSATPEEQGTLYLPRILLDSPDGTAVNRLIQTWYEENQRDTKESGQTDALEADGLPIWDPMWDHTYGTLPIPGTGCCRWEFCAAMFLAVFMSRADGRLIWITVPCWITRRCLHGWGYPSLYRRSGRSSVPW